jgi:hypothetical protein
MDEQTPGPVVIGMDPHRRTVTIEVMTPTERIVGRGRFTTVEGRVHLDAGVSEPLARPHLGDRRVRGHRSARRGPAAAAE